jgi:flagellar M-ring protein FliF
MDQLKRLYRNLTMRQKITLLAAALAVIGGLAAFSNWNRERDFKQLYTNLSGEDAAGVVVKLKEANTEYRLTENGSTVKVATSKVDEMRLLMASAGLPKTGRLGFELFDKTNFGATEFTEQVNYHRAIEGELERSVMSLSEVEHARIHITFLKQSVFLESREPAKASVMLKLKLGSKLSPQNVQAVCYLVASAVEGLLPESVSVVDMNGNLLNRPRKPAGDGAAVSDSVIEYRQKLEKDMLVKINSTLEPLLGPDKYKAGVSIDCDITSGEQSEEVYDPDRSVMVSSQKTEDMTGGSTAGGAPGTASNLPRPPARAGAGGTTTSRKTDNLIFQTSRLVKRTTLPQGAVKRLSISLLLDHNVRWEGAEGKSKRIVEAPAPEKLKAIRELVAGVTGLDEKRGDQLIVEALPFETTLQWQPSAAPAPQAAKPRIKLPWAPSWLAPQLEAYLQDMVESKYLIPAAIAFAAVALLLPLMLLRRLYQKFVKKTSRDGAVEMNREVNGARAAGELSAGEEGMNQPDLAKQLEAKFAEKAAQRNLNELNALAMLKLTDVPTKRGEVLAKHIAEEAKKNPEPFAQLIRTWLHEGEK